jgi:DNA-binding NtrC family response regulator
MTGQKCILLVSKDVTILQTRKLMISAYFEVHAAGRVAEAMMLLSERTFDLIILCHTLTNDECAKVIQAARERRAQTKILMLTTAGCAERTIVDYAHIAPEEGPFYLLKRSAEVLGFEFRKKGSMVQAATSKTSDCLQQAQAVG